VGTKLQGLTSGVDVSASAWTRVFNSFWFLAILVLVSAILTSLVFSSTRVVSTLPENPNLMFGIIDMCNEPASLSGVDPKLAGNGTGCMTTEPPVSATFN
jgi:hypothetical protein